jgi:hypothetical protein
MCYIINTDEKYTMHGLNFMVHVIHCNYYLYIFLLYKTMTVILACYKENHKYVGKSLKFLLHLMC